MKKVVLVCSVLACAIACNVAFADELPKDHMVAAASSSVSGYGDSMAAAIDGDPNVGWRSNWGDNTGAWLRIYLGGTCSVTQFDFLPYSYFEDRITGYEIYVTDSTSGNVADWGTAVATGTADPADTTLQSQTFAATEGRFAILLVTASSNDRLVGVMEATVHGTVLYTAGAELDKAGMVADANSQQYGAPANAIDGDTATPWRAGSDVQFSGAWLRINLGQQYRVNRFDFLPFNEAADKITEYEIYVTDSDSTVKEDWGTPAVSATCDTTENRKPMDFPAVDGQYVIFYTVSATRLSGCMEVYIYGGYLQPYVTAFAVADATSGIALATNSDTVAVTALTAEPPIGGSIEGYMITQSDVPPAPAAAGWTPDPPETYTFDPSTPYGDVTLYAYAKGNAGAVARRSTSISYAQDPAASDLAVLTNTDMCATVTWTTDVAAYGRVEYSVAGADTWTDTGWEAAAGTSHSRQILGLAPETAYDLRVYSNEGLTTTTYSHLPDGAQPYTEIPKNIMTATASSSYANDPATWGPQFAVNGLEGENGWLSNEGAGAWLRIDFGVGARYLVQQFGYKPRNPMSHGPISEFEIYVTDSDSPTVADWGEPVGSGPWPVTYSRKEAYLKPGGAGRYVILRTLASSHTAGAEEVWAYGYALTPAIETFAAADATSGSLLYTNERTVAIPAFTATAPEGETIAGYLINESETFPSLSDPGWVASAPGTYTITGDDGDIALHAWVKDSAGVIGTEEYVIYLQQTEPVVSDLLIAADTPESARAYFTTDVETFAKVMWTVKDAGDWQSTDWETAHGPDHAVRFTGLTPETSYDVIIVNNESEGSPVVYSHLPRYSEYEELPKGTMFADSNSVWAENDTDFGAANAINDDDTDQGWLAGGGLGSWLRIELDDVYAIRQFAQIPRDVAGHGPITAFELYVTEFYSTDKADWGDPVAYGDYWTNARTGHEIIPLPDTQGQYVILYPTDFYGNPGAAEVYIWGDAGLGPQLEGDVNGDCVVNILDLIGVRNHLNQDPTSPPENQVYNVNGDDAINILDMIFVRNRLNTSCPEG